MQDDFEARKSEKGGKFSAKTRDILVTVEPGFIADQSQVEEAVYAFSYKVKIENHGPQQVQLINRHWRVFSGGDQIADVKGEGVVGLQPLIPSQGSFEYQSWTIIQDPSGIMEGSYTLLTEDGEFFDVVIPRFELTYVHTGVLH